VSEKAAAEMIEKLIGWSRGASINLLVLPLFVLFTYLLGRAIVRSRTSRNTLFRKFFKNGVCWWETRLDPSRLRLRSGDVIVGDNRAVIKRRTKRTHSTASRLKAGFIHLALCGDAIQQGTTWECEEEAITLSLAKLSL